MEELFPLYRSANRGAQGRIHYADSVAKRFLSGGKWNSEGPTGMFNRNGLLLKWLRNEYTPGEFALIPIGLPVFSL